MSMKNAATIKATFEVKQAREDEFEKRLQKAQEDIQKK